MRTLGDFVIAKGDGTPSYQLAVVVDDDAARVTQVVRGDDLIDSTPRQIAIRRTLGLADRPITYWHLPLLVGPDGRRLAKRHGDTRLATYRAHGIDAAAMLRRLVTWCGIDAETTSPASARDLIERFDITRVARERIVVASDAF